MERETSVALPKRIGWTILIFLVYWDAFITYIRGGAEGNPLWKPLVDAFGPNALWFLAALVLAVIYMVVKTAGWYEKRSGDFPQGEKIVLTTITIAFGTYDAYITFLLPYFGFLGSGSHYAIIPLLLITVLVYNIMAECKRRQRS